MYKVSSVSSTWVKHHEYDSYMSKSSADNRRAVSGAKSSDEEDMICQVMRRNNETGYKNSEISS